MLRETTTMTSHTRHIQRGALIRHAERGLRGYLVTTVPDGTTVHPGPDIPLFHVR